MSQAMKKKLMMAGRILVNEGQADFTRGHISWRLPENPGHFLMKPRQMGLEEMTEDNIITCDQDGKKVAGGGLRHNEVFIHSEIFRLRPDVQAVIHTHPPHAVAFSALDRPIEPIGQPSILFCDALPVYAETIDLINNAERGVAVAECLGREKAMLLKNHGIVVAGGTLEEAVYLALVLEEACRLQLLVEAAGGPRRLFPPEDVKVLAERHRRPEASQMTFDYCARKFEPNWRREPAAV